jgi:hypothetical protein
MDVKRAGTMNENYVSRVKIDGFKSIKSCDLKLRELNVLIGPMVCSLK